MIAYFRALWAAFVIAFEDWTDDRADRDRQTKVAKIVRVFKRERELVTGFFSTNNDRVCDHPGRCAVGALLFAAGYDNDALNARGSCYPEEYEALSLVYGLDRGEVEGIIGANDGVRVKTKYDAEWNAVGEEVVTQTKVCSALPVNKARVCEVTNFVRSLEPA